MENNKFADLKILIFLATCGLGYYSHFVLVFPRDWIILAACLSLYGILTVIVYYVEHYVEREAFFTCQSHSVSCTFSNILRLND